MPSYTVTTVSVPYEITLLSNAPQDVEPEMQVSVPYEITLLSNYPKTLKDNR